MLAALLEAALRSFILSIVVWVGLRTFRIRNVVSQRNAWTTVLIGSLLMPFALPFTARWHVLPLATVPATTSLDHFQSAFAPTASTIASTAASSSSPSIVMTLHDQLGARQAAMATASHNFVHTQSLNFAQSSPRVATFASTFLAGERFSPVGIALLAYFLIAAVLLVRLLLGLASALRLWHSSIPIAPGAAAQIDADFNLRFSHQISTPVTIGSGVVLPADYPSWTEEKLRIVLAHERSHVNQHDFYTQILASLYAALAWFSPLGWWLKHKLSDLGEAISDGDGLNAATNRSAYAEVLLEFAAAPRPTLIGVAMARHSSISRRIERLLNDSYLRHAFSNGARARVAVLVVPAILFAAAALVSVQAATRSDQVVLAANATTATSTVVTGAQESPAAPSAASISATPADVSSLAPSEFALAAPPDPVNPSAAPQNSATQSESTFDRNLSFNGQLDLSVGTGSGNITFTRGPANQIHIHGIVKVNENGDPAQAQQIVANPPIEQDGNTVRIGAHGENLHNISISYEIESPDDTKLSAATGSGNIADTGVGNAAKLITGSGNITASGLQGGFKLQTGSGNITIDKAGQGEAKAQTGSGNINLSGVNGILQAQTGSGTIKAAGTPSSPWKLQTGSGNIELTTGSAPMDLDASTGSGRISTTPPIVMQSPEDHHHVHTQLNGGGPEVHVETGSGDIRVE